MKIVTFFATIVAAVLISFLIYFVKTHENLSNGKSLHVFLLSQNDDEFHLKINSTEFNSDKATEGDLGEYSYIGKVRKNRDSANIQFKARDIDTTFSIAVNDIDSITIGAQDNGKLYLKKF